MGTRAIGSESMSFAAIPSEVVQARAYRTAERWLVGSLVALSMGSLPGIFFYVFFIASTLAVPHARTYLEARLLLLFCLAPFLLSQILRHMSSVRLERRAEVLAVTGAGLSIEVPISAIGRIAPWALPLPGTGFSLVLRSGKRFRYAFEVTGTAAQAFQRLGFGPEQAPAEYPNRAYSMARAEARWRWYHWVIKYFLFPLIPGVLLFRLIQYVNFGGPFGEYQWYGLERYLRSFVLTSGGVWMECIMWASVGRAAGEVVAFAGAWLIPVRAAAIRRAVEIACTVLYYGGITSAIAIAFLR